MVTFCDLMENSLTPNHTIHDFRIQLFNFCLSITCTFTESISNNNAIMSSSSHDIKLNSCIKDKSLTHYD